MLPTASEAAPEATQDLLDDYAWKRINFRAQRLTEAFQLTPEDKEDMAQEMALAILKATNRFDPTRTRRKAFIRGILDREFKHLARRLRDSIRHSCLSPASASEMPDFHPAVNNPHQGELSDQARTELAMDLAGFIPQLPPRLQRIAECLKTHSPAETARGLGVNSANVYRAMRQIRSLMIEAGILDAQRSKKRGHAEMEKRGEHSSPGGPMPSDTPISLDVLISEPAEQYHGKAGHFLSSHQLLDFMKCPWLHRKKCLGLVADSSSPAYLIGEAAHVRIIEGQEAYQRKFAFGGPINPTTGRAFGAGTKAFAEWAQAQGKPVLTQEQIDLIEQMASGVAMNTQAVDLLAAGRAEGVVRATYCGVPCQIRIDWLNPRVGIVDFKTCDDLTWFEPDAKRFGYHKQMAFYRAVLAQVLNGRLVPVHLIAVEKKEPFRCGVWRVSEDTLATAQREIEAAIARRRKCDESGDWPTGYEGIRILNVA